MSTPRTASCPSLWILLVCLVFPGAVFAHNGAIAIALPGEGITVDGDLADWPATIEWNPVENWYSGGPARGADDISAHVAFAHDPRRQELFVAVDIRDDQPDSTEAVRPEGAFLSIRGHAGDEEGEAIRSPQTFDGTVDLRLPAGHYRVGAAPTWTDPAGGEVRLPSGGAAGLTLALSAPRVETKVAGRGRGAGQGLSVPGALATIGHGIAAMVEVRCTPSTGQE